MNLLVLRLYFNLYICENADTINYLKLISRFILNKLSGDIFDTISLVRWYQGIALPVSMVSMRVKSRGSGVGDTSSGNKSC